jgi:DNA-binding IclR family transcriptional regulator
MTQQSVNSKSGTQVIQRVAALLNSISGRNRIGARLVDLCEDVALERPTAHRILQGLVTERLVRQDEKSRRYFLGSLVYEMGLAAAPRTGLRDICHPYLQTIANQTGDTVFLTVRSGFDGVCMDRAEGAFPIKVFVLDVGRRRPLNVGGGALAIFSYMQDDEIDRIFKINKERTLEKYPNYSESLVRKKIAEARNLGYVVSEVIEVPGVRTVAVPVRDAQGQPIAGISVSTLAQRLEKDRLEMVTSSIKEAVKAIEFSLASESTFD